MPLDFPDAGSRGLRARLPGLGVALLVELAALTVLVGGVLWLAQAYPRASQIASSMLDLRLWLLILLVSGLGTAGNLGPYYLGKRGAQEVFARFPRLEGERWERVQTAFRRTGPRLLILSGIPTLGLVLTTAAGVVGTERSAFLGWVMLSKVIRNWLLVLVSYVGLQLAIGTSLV